MFPVLNVTAPDELCWSSLKLWIEASEFKFSVLRETVGSFIQAWNRLLQVSQEARLFYLYRHSNLPIFRGCNTFRSTLASTRPSSISCTWLGLIILLKALQAFSFPMDTQGRRSFIVLVLFSDLFFSKSSPRISIQIWPILLAWRKCMLRWPYVNGPLYCPSRLNLQLRGVLVQC